VAQSEEVLPPAERFSALFHEHYDALLRYTTRRVGAEAAADIAADVFLTAWRQLERAPVTPLPWLYRIAANAINNHRRGELRELRLVARVASRGGDGASYDSRDPAHNVAEAQRVAAAMRRLTARDREALRLVTWEDLTVADAAVAMGCSETAMKVRLHRARRLLARFLDDHDDHSPDADGAPLPETSTGNAGEASPRPPSLLVGPPTAEVLP
jgi:RNA polymerase sigma factor (sigma-70 family)